MTIRIIGGTHRGRRIQVPKAVDLRPTTDAIRETLFNWLAADIADARVLDAFAGSGALGVEALSRGAAFCQFIEMNRAVARVLRENLHQLDFHASQFDVSMKPAQKFLSTEASASFDIICIDPPFRDPQLVLTSLADIKAGSWLAPGGCVYVEVAKQVAMDFAERGWDVHREKISGAVRYALITPSSG